MKYIISILLIFFVTNVFGIDSELFLPIKLSDLHMSPKTFNEDELREKHQETRKKLITDYVNLVFTDENFKACFYNALKQVINVFGNVNVKYLTKMFEQYSFQEIRHNIIESEFQNLEMENIDLLLRLQRFEIRKKNETRSTLNIAKINTVKNEIVTDKICDYLIYFNNLIKMIMESDEFKGENIAKYFTEVIAELSKKLKNENPTHIVLTSSIILLYKKFVKKIIESFDGKYINLLVEDKDERINLIKKLMIKRMQDLV